MKKRILAMILSMAMVFTMLPAKTAQAVENVSPAAAEEELDLDSNPVAEGNLARSATASAAHQNTPVKNVNDGTLATGNPATSWNSWGAPESSYPMHVTLTWNTQKTISSMRVMWWSDGGGVAWPSVAYLEYKDGNDWKSLPNVGTGHGEINGGGQRIWNIVNFASPITTTGLRMRIGRNKTGSAGVGISEWEVYGSKIKERLDKAEIVGRSKIQLGKTETYTGSTIPESKTEQASYQWSVASSSDVIEIQGDADQREVIVKGVKLGKATLKLSATYEDVTKESEFEIRVREDKVESIDTYETSTAAGVAPILPSSVVANGVEFDDPTPSSKSWTKPNFDFAEEFNSSLIPVTWESVRPEDYAKGKEGSKFQVKGTALYDGKNYEAVAEITVKPSVTAAESNSSVTFENVQLNDIFWAPKQETNALTSLKVAINKIEQPSGGEPNFDNAIKRLNGDLNYGEYSGYVFQDSDIYKSIEAISYTLSATQNDNNPELATTRTYLQNKLNTWIEKIEKVQYADGYLNTYFALRGSGAAGGGGGSHRWIDFSGHEMYNAGHFLEGAVAYTRYREGIGSPDYRLYVVGKRLADHIVATFGPNGKRHEVPGHEEIEIGMVKFGKLAEEYEGQGAGQKYYDTVKLLIDRRGEGYSLRESGYYGGTYSQDATPFKEETNAVGHAVRANYFYAGVTDIATMLPEDNADRNAYLASLDAICDSVTEKKTYITGAIGTTTPGSDSEGYGMEYDLPPDGSYAEICAAIAAANWNQRMNLLHEDAKYIDMVERNLYNAILVGENLDGNLFYYSTLLEATNGNRRSEWFDCACCPPNLMRTIAAVSGYMYAVNKDTIFVNMYSGSDGSINVGGTQVNIKQVTNYPWEGTVKMTVNPKESKEFTMKIRIPGWVSEQMKQRVTIKVNDEPVTAKSEKGYVAINRTWKANDVIDIDMPMEIRKTESNPMVESTKGEIALQRGPIVYCMEKAGNAQLNAGISNFNPLNFVIPRDAELNAEYNAELLKGVVEITGDVKYNNGGTLVDAKLQAIPYYAWNNRGNDADYTPGLDSPKNNSSQMLIWTKASGEAPKNPGDNRPSIPEVTEKQVRSYATPSSCKGYSDEEGTWDPNQKADKFADDDASTFWNGWRSNDITEDQWIMYDFGTRKAKLSGSKIDFYDDGGGVRVPEGIKIEYEKADGTWTEVTKTGDDWAFEKINDNTYRMNSAFEAVETSKIRVTMVHKMDGDERVPVAVFDWSLTGSIAASEEDKKEVTDQINLVKDILSGLHKEDYDAKTWNALQEAIKAAEDAAAKPDADAVNDLNAAQKALADAYANLKIEPVDTTALEAAIREAEGKNESDYTPESYGNLKTALDAAKEIMDKEEKNILRSEANAAKKALDAAIAGLKLKSEGSTADKKALNAAITEAGKKKQIDYTVPTWKKLKTALSEAQKIAKDKNAVQSQVNKAKSDLDKAVSGLKKLKTASTKKVTLGVGEKYSVFAKNYTYLSSNTKVATVSSKGEVKIKKTGSVVIKAIDKSGKKAKVYQISAKKAPDKKAKISLNKKKVTLVLKNKKKKTFTIKPKISSKYGCGTFKYAIDKKGRKAVTVDKNGKITAKKKGKATITVKTYNGKGKAAKITVTVK